jgi:hypothetical protein
MLETLYHHNMGRYDVFETQKVLENGVYCVHRSIISTLGTRANQWLILLIAIDCIITVVNEYRNEMHQCGEAVNEEKKFSIIKRCPRFTPESNHPK